MVALCVYHEPLINAMLEHLHAVSIGRNPHKNQPKEKLENVQPRLNKDMFKYQM